MLKKTYCVATGECFVRKRISKGKYIKINNREISRYKIKKFLHHLNIEKQVRVILSNKIIKDKDNTIIWGHYFYFSNTIVLYRHSVWTLLHEVAHYLSRRYFPAHGKIFNDKLKFLYDFYMMMWSQES